MYAVFFSTGIKNLRVAEVKTEPTVDMVINGSNSNRGSQNPGPSHIIKYPIIEEYSSYNRQCRIYDVVDSTKHSVIQISTSRAGPFELSQRTMHIRWNKKCVKSTMS
jgi:hypothetical protein